MTRPELASSRLEDDTAEVSWPEIDVSTHVDDPAHYTVLYEPELELDGVPSIALVRRIGIGRVPAAGEVVWRHSFATRVEAHRAYRWMQSRRNEWQFWGRLTSAFGPAGFIERLDASVSEERAQRLEALLDSRARARSKKAREEEKARARAEKEKVIESYLVEEDGYYGIDLRRGGRDEGFFVICFRERWERERFRDWFRAQKHRWPEFAETFETSGSDFLERQLLREMLETEKRVKKLGMGAGGRRPLRFYRGDE